MNNANHISDDVRAAIGAFLDECQKEARPFAVTEVLGAIRRMYPALDISDIRLVNAIASEASAAGFDAGGGGRRERNPPRGQDELGGAPAVNESELPDPCPTSHQYGRRVEADGSWTIYHVFTGTPASICGHSMVGLSQLGATEVMTFLNNEGTRKDAD